MVSLSSLCLFYSWSPQERRSVIDVTADANANAGGGDRRT